MISFPIKNTILGILFISFLFFSCSKSQLKTSKSSTKKSYISLQKQVFQKDTVVVNTAVELVKSIRSNRLIKLSESNYNIKNTLEIDSVNNLKIEGNLNAKIIVLDNVSSVVSLSNCTNIFIDSLEISYSKNSTDSRNQGGLKIKDSRKISISNSKLIDIRTVGLTTYNVNDLTVNNTLITGCTGFLFELEKSKRIEFKKVKFLNNNLGASVLGGFTNSTEQVRFLDCEFKNNIPAMIGNPVFNFRDNFSDFKDKITFKNCLFKNNKGYKWYGEKIKLIECEIDSTDFVGLQVVKKNSILKDK